MKDSDPEVIVSEQEYRCFKCNHEMVQGYILDHQLIGSRKVYWSRGEPEVSLAHGGHRPSDEVYAIGAFRCVYCGYVEMFARDQFNT